MSSHSKQYEFLIVGSGLYGSICAHELQRKGCKVLVIDKRQQIGGNCHTKEVDGVHVHQYGPHIFHTNDKKVWDWINEFATFNNFRNTPVAEYKGQIFSLPFSMWTFNQMWGVTTPEEAMAKIEEQRYTGPITNLEEQALALVGKDVYEKLIKGYTSKQWRKDPKQLPASIIKRLPVRFTWDNNYFNDRYQGVPVGGYTQIFQKLLANVEVKLGEDYFKDQDYWNSRANKIIYTGPIDQFFDYRFGDLEYKSVRWEDQQMQTDNYQGIAVKNYTAEDVPHTRIIEHKYFDDQGQKKTYVSWEYPQPYERGVEPFYPVNDKSNTATYSKYRELAQQMKGVHFGGRLGTYKYYDMHQVIAQALHQLETNPFF